MKKFSTVEGSMGSAPRFEITCGLQEGYGPNAKVHTVDEAVAIIEEYLKKRAAAEEPYLTGMVMSGSVVYAWLDTRGKAGSNHEPQITYAGNKNPKYHSALLESQMRDLLNDLADHLGSALGQTRVYVAYSGDMWIRQAEESATPTGEEVR
jgi:hypothetical protein